jgi:hypothetical protein
VASFWILRRIVIAKHHPSALLLAAQLLAVLLYALVGDLPGGRAVLAAIGLVVLGAALQVVRNSPWLTWFGSTLAFIVVVLLGASMIWPSTHLDIAASAVLATFYFYSAGALIAYMLQDTVASLDEFYAVGATFTLLAWAFAHLYIVGQALVPGSFAGAVDPEKARTWMDLLFLSFTTLSGVGLGDIVPLSPLARALVMLEELAGIMYIALVVSRLITLAAAAKNSSSSSGDAP